MALLAGSAEFFGGLALILGLLTRPAAVALTFTMIVPTIQVHLGNGLFMPNDGYEFGLSFLVICVALAVQGGGTLSVDRVIDRGTDAPG
jgi:putative oxidoreductase